MFNLPKTFQKLVESQTTIQVSSEISLTFQLPNSAQHDWSVHYSEKNGERGSFTNRLFEKAIMSAALIKLNGTDLADYVDDESAKEKIKACISKEDTSKETLDYCYTSILESIFGNMPDELVKRAYASFSEWRAIEEADLIPEDTAKLEDDLLNDLGSSGRGNL